jgi:hypothetical protein
MPNDDKIWAMFEAYVFVTVKQAQEILGCKPDYIQVRLRRLYEAGYLGRVQQSVFTDYLYFLTEQGAMQAIERGAMIHKWYVQKKSLMQIPHDSGVTACQIALFREFPHMQSRRWRTDLQKDFDGEVPDLFFNLHDGTGWTPFEYERLNPVSQEKLHEYSKTFNRSYVVVQTERRAANLLSAIEHDIPTTKLWFTTKDLLLTNTKGKIWWTPKDYATRQRSILKPE